MEVDLRSDTVTKPTRGMRETIVAARVGDDVFGEDPTVMNLEKRVAEMFGKEAGLFCPSGTMANQVAVKVLTQPREEVICDNTSHVYLYEGGGLAFNSGLSVWTLQGDRGRITGDQVQEAVRPDNDYSPRSRLVVIENTHNRGGGSVYTMDSIKDIRKTADKNDLYLHLDGARIFNAITAAGYTSHAIGKYFDTISVCMSKGLGAPVGSVLLSSAKWISEARKIRKVLGGGMRQVGILAAAGLYALDHHIPRLADDHRRAKDLEEVLLNCSFIREVLPVETNIIVAKLQPEFAVEPFVETLERKKIKVVPFGKQTIRLVTHLDFDDEQLQYVTETLKKIS